MTLTPAQTLFIILRYDHAACIANGQNSQKLPFLRTDILPQASRQERTKWSRSPEQLEQQQSGLCLPRSVRGTNVSAFPMEFAQVPKLLARSDKGQVLKPELGLGSITSALFVFAST